MLPYNIFVGFEEALAVDILLQLAPIQDKGSVSAIQFQQTLYSIQEGIIRTIEDIVSSSKIVVHQLKYSFPHYIDCLSIQPTA